MTGILYGYKKPVYALWPCLQLLICAIVPRKHLEEHWLYFYVQQIKPQFNACHSFAFFCFSPAMGKSARV